MSSMQVAQVGIRMPTVRVLLWMIFGTSRVAGRMKVYGPARGVARCGSAIFDDGVARDLREITAQKRQPVLTIEALELVDTIEGALGVDVAAETVGGIGGVDCEPPVLRTSTARWMWRGWGCRA